MPEPQTSLQSLLLGDALAATEVVRDVHDSHDVVLLIAASVFAHDRHLLTRAEPLAQTTAHRQLAAIASAHLSDDPKRVRELARDHLADHPESVLVAWIAARSGRGHPEHVSASTASSPDPTGSRPPKVSS